ncbi:YHYH protein [Marinomonas colpomeniae]|uniref:YHYH protein n=1 Tax=Marinomonas colpomeniae TaxID=2774408 RepID=UPI0019D60219|nr:YHYH protein [Marinomonas colpomeniae]
MTELSLRKDNAVFLNGVKLDLLAAGCFGVRDGFIGCGNTDQPFRFDPMSSLNNFGTDSHNAHTQPDGAYHYHGNPIAMFSSNGGVASPVIGFATDGFPIYGSYFDDEGVIRKAKSSYVLKENDGKRTDITFAGKKYSPGGSYDGKFVDDYEYDKTSGDLDECNGMSVNGTYGYYVTDAYPWVLKCFKGTPDSSFDKRRG